MPALVNNVETGLNCKGIEDLSHAENLFENPRLQEINAEQRL